MRAVAFIDSSAHQSAEAFYNWCNIEPITFGGTVIDTLQVSSTYAAHKLSLRGVLKNISYSLGPGEGAVIVGHGNDHALLLPLIKETTQKLTRETAVALNNYLSGFDKRKAADVANSTQIRIRSKADFLGLCELISDVRSLGLGHVALRACNLGATGIAFMEDLKKLFNCQMISGPMVKDAYVDWNASQKARSPEDFEKVLQDNAVGHLQVWGTAPNRVAFHVKQSPEQQKTSSFSLSSLARSATAVQAFLQEQFSTTKPFTYRQGMIVPIHAFYWKNIIVFPNSKFYSQLLCTCPSFKEIPLPMYIPPEESFTPRQGLISRIRSNIQERRLDRRS